MRFAYLITAYDNAEHLVALVNRLCPPGTPDVAIIHIDAKSELRHQSGAIAAANPAVRLVPRPVAVHWGHANMIEAIRLLLRAAMGHDFTHAHLISGSDWPLVSRERRVAEFGERCWIEAVPGVQSERMEVRRFDSRYLRPDPSKPFDWYRARLLKELSFRLPRRTHRPFGEWHKGLSWWSLPRDVCETVLGGLDRGFAQGVFKGVIVGDEHAVQTIVAHHYPERIERHRHFLRWPEGAASPAWLNEADWAMARASDAWFARKLSVVQAPFLLEEAV